MGQLYINYPAVESYRDFEEIGDTGYLDRAISAGDCHRYKQIVGQYQNGFDNVQMINPIAFARMLAMHVANLQHVIDQAEAEETVYWGQTDSLGNAGAEMEGRLYELLKLENQALAERGEVIVCCTCLLFVCAWPDRVDAVWRKAR